MDIFIPTEERLKEIVISCINGAIDTRVPEIVRRAKQKPWMTTREAMNFLGLNRRQLQYLRDTKGLPHEKKGRKIFYPTKAIESWLQENMPERWKKYLEGELECYDQPEEEL